MAAKVVNVRDGVPYDVYVGRNLSLGDGKYGNPVRLENEANRDTVLVDYMRYLYSKPELIADAKRELRGKTLACHCAPKLCHAMVLLLIANS